MVVRRSACLAAAVVVCVGGFAPRARATFHEWRISEVYSNASGSAQFIEFLQPSAEFDDERFVGGQTLTDSALGHSYTFPGGLPSEPEANSHFLVATPGFASLPGAPAVDYLLPSNNFFSTTGDTLTYAGFVDSLHFNAGQLPTDGTNSINRAYGAVSFLMARNSPTNFAGASGSVPEPTGAGALLAAAGLFACRRRRHPVPSFCRN